MNYVSPRMDPMGGPEFLFDFTRLKLYRPEPYAGRAYLFRRCLDGSYYPDPTLGWGRLIADLETFEIPGSHLAMFDEPVVEALARHVIEGISGTREQARSAAGQS